MKILLDENLSPRLLSKLGSLFPELTHVRQVGLERASDHTIWNWAREHNTVVLTGDADFLLLNQQLGWPPKVIHIEHCDFPLRVIEELLRTNANPDFRVLAKRNSRCPKSVKPE